MNCRYPSPCPCDYCEADNPRRSARDYKECKECFAVGRHEPYCDKTR